MIWIVVFFQNIVCCVILMCLWDCFVIVIGISNSDLSFLEAIVSISSTSIEAWKEKIWICFFLKILGGRSILDFDWTHLRRTAELLMICRNEREREEDLSWLILFKFFFLMPSDCWWCLFFRFRNYLTGDLTMCSTIYCPIFTWNVVLKWMMCLVWLCLLSNCFPFI